MLQLRMAVRAEQEQIGRVVPDLRVKVVHLKIRLTVRFLEGEGAELTPPIVQFAKENANCRWYALVAFSSAGMYFGTWPAYRFQSNSGQLVASHGARPFLRHARERIYLLLGFRIGSRSLKLLSGSFLLSVANVAVQRDPIKPSVKVFEGN